MGYSIEKGNMLVIHGSNEEEALQELVNITKGIRKKIVEHPEYTSETIPLVFVIDGARLEEYKFFSSLPNQKELVALSEQFIKQLIQYNKDYQPIYTHEELETGTFAVEYLVNTDLAKLPLYIEFLGSIDLDHTVEQIALVDRLFETYEEEKLGLLIDFLSKCGGELFDDWFRLREPAEQSPLHEAVQKGNILLVRKLLEQKNINLAELDSMNGYSPLHYSQGSIEMAKLLIEAGADINCQNIKKETILHKCLAENGYYNLSFIKYILNSGADIGLKDENGRSAIHHVRTIEGLNLILKQGGRLNDQDNEGNTLLHILAPWVFETELFMEILKSGADPNAVNEQGRNPLYLSAINGKAEIAKIFYESGADPDLKDKNGNSTRDIRNYTFFN